MIDRPIDFFDSDGNERTLSDDEIRDLNALIAEAEAEGYQSIEESERRLDAVRAEIAQARGRKF